jgi:MFS transporter, YQGE family, putative transporter
MVYNSIVKIIRQQRAAFAVFNREARMLIVVNFLFALFNPFYLIFANTFIFQNTNGNIRFNLLYSMLNFTGVLTGFVLNGFILRKRKVKNQLVLGMWLLFLSTTLLFLVPKEWMCLPVILFFGLFSGTGNGIYWSSRNYITLVSTHDENRDFFTGLEFILISSGRVITPLLIGLYIGEGTRLHLFSAHFAYRSSLIFAFILLFIITCLLQNIDFPTKKLPRFLFFKYHDRWWKNRKMFAIMGLYQGVLLAVPPVLILMFLGNESVVGFLNSFGYIVAMLVVYYISKRSRPQHRPRIMGAGALVFFTGSFFFCVLVWSQPALATVLLILSIFFSEPVMTFPQRATFMRAIEEVTLYEKRHHYAYIVDTEIITNLARISSIMLFLFLTGFFEMRIAICIYMSLIALLQFGTMKYSKAINAV